MITCLHLIRLNLLVCGGSDSDVTPPSWVVQHSCVYSEASVITSPVRGRGSSGGSSCSSLCNKPQTELIKFSAVLSLPQQSCSLTDPLVFLLTQASALIYVLTWVQLLTDKERSGLSTVNRLHFKLRSSLMWLLVSNKGPI